MKNQILFLLLCFQFFTTSFTYKSNLDIQINKPQYCGINFDITNSSSGGSIIKRVAYFTNGNSNISQSLYLQLGDTFVSNLVSFDNTEIDLKIQYEFEYIDLLDENYQLIQRVYFDPNQPTTGNYLLDYSSIGNCGITFHIVVH